MTCRLACLLWVGVGLLGVATSCRELPPPLEPSAVGDDVRVPVRAYAPDPFHPANLWFERVFGQRDEHGRILAADPTAPFPSELRLQAVDHAELLALLDELTLESIPDPVRRSIFRADALQLAGFLPLDSPDPLTRELAGKLFLCLTALVFPSPDACDGVPAGSASPGPE